MRWAICPFFISKFYLQIIDKMKSNWRKRLAKFEQKLTDMLRPAVEETGKSLLGIEFISAGNN